MKKASTVYRVSSKVDILGNGVLLGALDPNDEDIFYVESQPYYYMYNIHTRRWSEVACDQHYDMLPQLCVMVLPWWPTPLRRLPLQVEELPI